MDHIKTGIDVIANRFGLHYFPDSLHYGEKDLKLWLPRLQQLNAGWLVLNSPTSRAIPEEFISGLAQAKIQPIVDFNFPLSQAVPWSDLEVLLREYGRWGVTHAVLNQQPNNQLAWSIEDWRRPDFLQAYTRQFQQFAALAIDCGVKPVFAPLAQGGDYWDLAFLEAALKQLVEETSSYLVNNLTFSAYAWDQGKSLDWGTGGSKVWKGVRAYKVPKSSQDQRGFRAYEWYQDVIQSILGKKLPMLLFQAGLSTDPSHAPSDKAKSDPQKVERIYRLLNGENVFDPEIPQRLISAVSPEVQACSFYLLSSSTSDDGSLTWFNGDGSAQDAAKAILTLRQKNTPPAQKHPARKQQTESYVFEHGRYVLIAQSLKPRMAEILQKMHAYISRYKPVIGFSCEEARKSACILVIAYQEDFPQKEIEQLQSSGSLVRVIRPDDLRTSFAGS